MQDQNQNTTTPVSYDDVVTPTAWSGIGVAPEPVEAQALALDPSSLPSEPLTEQAAKKKESLMVRLLRRADLALIILLVVGSVSLIVGTTLKKSHNQKAATTAADQYKTVTIPLSGFIENQQGINFGNSSVQINGSLNVSSGLVISPSVQPSKPTSGQLYFDQNTDQLAYYNGTAFVPLSGNTQPVVQNIAGVTGAITLGGGLSVVGNQLVSSTGVTAVGSATGAITVGSGLSISGNNLQNSGVLSLVSGTPANLTITNDGNGNLTISNSGAGSGTVTSGGGTSGRLALFTGSQNIEDSLVSQASTTVTVNGDLSVNNALNLGTALSVSNGGTGTNTLGANGVLVGNGTGAISSVTTGSAGLCLLSASGSAPTWNTCPGAGGSGVSSLNTLTGALTIANATTAASTITINDATTTGTKGIASFNSTNFTVASGAVNTVQDINSTATPSFGRLTISSSQATNPMLTVNNTNAGGTGSLLDLKVNGTSKFSVQPNGTVTSAGGLAIAPSGTLTVGSSTQPLSLQGDATTSLAATGGGFTTTVGFTGAPTASVTYNFDRSATGGPYTICTTVGNCAGIGNITGGGTSGTIAVFTAAGAIGDSVLSQSGGNLSSTGSLSLASGKQYQINGTQISSANLSNDSNLAKLGTSQTFTGNANNFVNGSDSNAAFTVQNAATKNVLAVDTTNKQVVLGTASTFDGVLVLKNATNANTVSIAPGTQSGNHSITLPDANGTVCLNGSASCGFLLGSGSAFLQNGNSFGASAVLGTNDNNSLTLRTNSNPVLTLAANGKATFANDLEVDGANFTSSGALSVTPGGTLTVGSTSHTLTLQGDAGTTLAATGGGFTTTVGFTGSPTASIAYNFDRSATGGPYTICTTAGNCSGVGGGIAGSGSSNNIAKFTGASTIGNSGISDNGTTVTTAELLDVQGASVTVGVPNTQTGSLILADGGSAFSGTIVQGVLTGAQTYTLPATGGIICVDSGNCAGSGNGVTGNGTAGTLPVFTGSGHTVGDSVLSQSGGNLSSTGSLSLASGKQYQINGTQISSANLSNDGNLAKLNATQTFTGGTVSFVPSADSTNAFNLQSASGAYVTGDSTDNALVLGKASTIDGTLVFQSAGSAHKATITPLGLTADRAINLPDAGGTICTTSGNCAAAGGAGGDLTGSYPNPTIAKLQGITLTAGSPTSADILQYNGSAWVNQAVTGDITINNSGVTAIGTGKVTSTNILDGTIANVDLSTGSFGNITGVGTLGSLTVSGTITANTITPSAALTVGATGKSFTLQGDNTSTITATGGSGTTTIGFAAPTANVTINFPAIASGGPYTVCTTNGNCAAAGSAGGDLTGSYPNPTIAKLQGTTLTAGSPTSADILQYNGSAWVNQAVSGDITINSSGATTIGSGKVTSGNILDGTIADADLSTGTFTHITGVGTLGSLSVSGTITTNTISPSSSPFTLGAVADAFTLQGTSASTITAKNGANTTTLGFDNPTANVTLNFPALAGGPYDICTSSGNCSGAGGTLQTAYNNSTNPEIVVNGTNGAVTIRDNSTPIGANLLEVQNNAGTTTYLGVAVAGTTVGNNLTVQPADGLVLGVGGSATGGIQFLGASGAAHTLTLRGPATPNVGNFVLSLPAITNNANVCTDNSICTGYQASGNYLIQAPSSTATNTISPTGSTTGLTVNGSATATLAMSIAQGQAADALDVAVSNGAGTATNAISVAKSAGGTLTNGLNVGVSAGTLTNAININQSGGTLTTGILFGGTIGGDAIQFTGSSTVDIANTASTLKLLGNSGVTITASGANTASIDSAGAGSVLLGNTNATTVTVGNTNATTTSVQGGTAINIGTASAGQTITLGATGQTGNINIGQATASSSIINIGNGSFSAANTQTVNIATGASGSGNDVVSIGSSSATSTTTINGGNGISLTTNVSGVGTTVKTSTDSSAGFLVQDALGSTSLGVDTTNISTIVTNGSMENSSNANWSNKSGTGTPTRDCSQAFVGSCSEKVVLGTGNTDSVQYTFGSSLSANTYSLLFAIKQTAGDAINASAKLDIGYNNGSDHDTACTPSPSFSAQNVPTTGWAVYTCSFTTTGTTTAIYWKQVDTPGVARTFYLDTIQVEQAANSNSYHETALQLNGVVNSRLSVQNTSDSTNAFLVQNAAGTNAVFRADTLNSRAVFGNVVTNTLLNTTRVLIQAASGGRGAVIEGGDTSTDILDVVCNGASTVDSFAASGALVVSGNSGAGGCATGGASISIGSVGGGANNIAGQLKIADANAHYLTLDTVGNLTGAETLNFPAVASGSNICTDGAVCTGYANTALSNLSSVAINVALGFQSTSAATINFNGAAAGAANGLTLTGQTAGGANNDGGAVTIQGGTATGANAGGLLSLLGGAPASSSGTNGGVTIDTGNVASAAAGTIAIGNSNFPHTINIGAGGTSTLQTVTIGSVSGLSATTLQANRGGVSVATGASSTINITTGSISIKTGDSTGGGTSASGGVTIDTGTTPGGTTGTVSIGGTNASAITIGSANATSGLSFLSGANVTIGASDTTGTLLVLDTKTTSGDPTGVNGGMYYNSNSATFRCFQNSGWVDCLSGNLQGAYNQGNTITATDNRNITFTMADTSTDPNFIVNLQCVTSCSTNGRFAVQSAGTDVFTIGPDGKITLGTTANNMSLDATNHEPTLNGTARHTRTVTLPAEYPGAVMTADGTNNSGTMTSDNMTSSPYRNYYHWTTTQGTAQDYDIWVKVPMPSDFSALPSGQTICMDVFASATTANTIALTLYDTGNSSVSLSDGDLTPSSTNTWQNQCTSSITGGTYAANGDMTLDIKLTAPATTGDVRIGDITFSYLSKF